MKSSNEKGKLRLVKQTVRTLTNSELEAVRGGDSLKRKTGAAEQEAFDGQVINVR